MTETETSTPAVRITGSHDDVVQVMRVFDVEAPDWTPPHKAKAIAPRKVVAVWVDGKIHRIAVSGPYRRKNGTLAQPQFERDESHIGGTGSPDHRPDWDRMTHVALDADGRVCVRRPYGGSADFPDWMPGLIAEHGPVL